MTVQKNRELELAWQKLRSKLPQTLAAALIEEARKVSLATISHDEAMAFIQSRFPTELAEPLTPQKERRISKDIFTVDSAHNGSCTGKKPQWFELAEKKHIVNTKTWKEMLLLFCNEVYSENKNNFGIVLLQIQGRRRPYFSKYASKLENGCMIAGSHFYVETNLSANNVKSLCDVLVKLFGYGQRLEVGYW